MKYFSIILFVLTLTIISYNWPADDSPVIYTGEKIRGMSLVGPPDPFIQNPIPALQQIGSDWVGIIPFGFCPLKRTTISYDRNGANYQWWGERPEGTLQAIQLAKEKGLKVMLKPQLYVPNGWPGAIDFDSEADWKKWEAEYESFILFFAEMAAAQQVDLFCIGTEFKIALQKREPFWVSLVDKIKRFYQGPLTYASNWDEYHEVGASFWQRLDYIGIDAYFPLLEDKTPDVSALVEAWKPKRKMIRNFSSQIKRPVIFTEFGYLTTDGCAWQAWELEKVVRQLPVNELAQANAIDALFQTFWQEPYWAGGFYWKWFPNMQGISDYPERDYSPQGKEGEEVLKKWFLKSDY